LTTALGDSKTNSPLDQNPPINHNNLRSQIRSMVYSQRQCEQDCTNSTGIECYTKLIPLANWTPLCYTIKCITPSTQGTSEVTKLKCCHNNQQTCLKQKGYMLEDNSAVGVLIPSSPQRQFMYSFHRYSKLLIEWSNIDDTCSYNL